MTTGPDTLLSLLAYMKQHGQSVSLNWGEDDDQWECSWITNGTRFTAFAYEPVRAAQQAVQKAVAEARRITEERER